uniref:RING-type domain-containing protein n=1 Tax=Plectus sambesii TaxID=2011161 RepID=A0A914XGL6_9BILA
MVILFSDRSLPSDRTRRRRPASRSEESLQTLLDAASEAREIRFDSETTLADAQHDLAGVDQLHLLPQLDLRYQTPTLFHEHELEDRLLRSLEQGGRKVLDRLSRLGRSDQGSKETSSSLDHSETVPPLAVRSPLKVMPEYPAVMRNAPKNRRRRVVNANSSSPSPSPLDGSRNSPTLSLTITRDSLTRDQHANDSLSSPSESLPSTVVTQADVHRSSSDDFMKPVVSRPNDMNKCVDVDDWQNASSPTDGKDSILESSGTPTELSLASRVSCLRCGLHRSWAFLLKLGKFVSSVPVSPDDYLEGGVPASVKQWAELFRTCVSLRSTRNDNTPLCSSCASLFEQQGEPNDALPLEIHNIQTNLITPLVRSVDDAQLKRLFLFPSAKTPKSSKRLSSKVKEENGGKPMKEEPTKVLSQESCNETPALISSSSQSTPAAVPHLPSEETNGISVAESTETAATTSSHSHIDSEQSTPTNDLLAYSTYVNPAYSSVGEESGHFGWAGSVRLADLCLAMSYVLGVDAVFDLVEADAALAKALDASDWARLAAFVRPPTSRIEFGPPELLDALFRDVADGRETSTRVRYSTTNGHPSPTRPGFVLSVIEECPCCTLPLNTRVSDVERKLTVFDCGHAYHTICLLQDKSLKQCIRCILQRP